MPALSRILVVGRFASPSFFSVSFLLPYINHSLSTPSFVHHKISEQDAHKQVGLSKRRTNKIRPKARAGGIVGRFSNFGKCRSEVSGDVKYGVAVD